MKSACGPGIYCLSSYVFHSFLVSILFCKFLLWYFLRSVSTRIVRLADDFHTTLWGFENMELNRVEAQVHPSNAASLKSLMRLGFTEEGCLREVAYWGGEYHNLLQFSVLRNEWKSRPPNSIRR